MVRLKTHLARTMLLAATLTIAAHASPQASTSQAPPPPPPAPSSPITPGQPLHWRAQGNTIQPVQPMGAPAQQPAAATTSQAMPSPTAQTSTPTGVTLTPPPASPQPGKLAHRRSSRSSKTAEAEAPPQPPPPPPTLDQQPPTPPQVHFQNGELTIDAHNATLAQVLRAVQSQTGASIDVPSGANSERVATQIGPGQPRDVLNTLLNGSKFDYVILGVAGDPGAVQKVILTPRQAALASPAQNNPVPEPAEAESQDENSAENEVENQNPEPPVPPRPGGLRRPGFPGQPLTQPPNNNFPPDQQPPQAQDNGAKTPEQLMQELQQMQQQQQQLQEQLNPANRQPQ